jgi:hypothetical protein
MKLIGTCSVLALGFVTCNVFALPVNCQKATVDAGGVSNTEYFCDDGAAFESPPPLAKYFVLRPDGMGSNPATPLLGQANKAHCAVNKYGSYHVPSDWKVQYLPEYGWLSISGSSFAVSPGPTGPSAGGPYRGLDAITDLARRLTSMYATSSMPRPPELTGIGQMIRTLEHEAAHIGGVPDTTAGDIVADNLGEAANQAFVAHGSTCP